MTGRTTTQKAALALGLRAGGSPPPDAQVIVLPGRVFGDDVAMQKVRQQAARNGWKSCNASLDGARVKVRVW